MNRWGMYCVARHIRDRLYRRTQRDGGSLGQGHGHNQKAWDTLYEAVMEMNKVADEYKQKYQLNFSVLATPAEGLSGYLTGDLSSWNSAKRAEEQDRVKHLWK